MSLNKSIEHGKSHRKAYRGTKAFDPTCRNHGSCSYCESNRMHKHRKREDVLKCKLKNYNQGAFEYSDYFNIAENLEDLEDE